MTEILEPFPRTIVPRHRQRKTMPIIAVYDQRALTESGELLTLDDLTDGLPDRASTLFATDDSLNLLVHFDHVFSVTHSTVWQWRTSNDYQVSHRSNMHQAQNGKRRSVTKSVVAVSYLGFRRQHYHKLIDPVTMFKQGLSKVLPGDDDPLVKLWRWAIELRNFCQQNNVDVRPTMGAIGAQFLTDPRFYPKPRRKVPAHTNASAREYLPGNHYHLTVTPRTDRTYSAYVVDQYRAHHYHAQRIHFPNADHLYAYGYYRNLSRYYRDCTSPDFMGLYCLDLEAPNSCAFTWLGRGRLERRFIFTSELPHLLDMGYKVLGVRAAWGSHHREEGLNRYATWAQEQLDFYSQPWMKPLLLSTYGSLASRKSFGETVFRLASRGEVKTLGTRKGTLTGKFVRRPKALEPGITNVIHLGMIQAATRSESVGFAQWISRQGQRVLHVFADAVFLEANDDKPLPELLPEPWRIKRELTHYQPINSQAYTSDQETKNPGVRADHRDRRVVHVRPPRLTASQ